MKHNREKALEKYLQRLIKTGKKLNAAQQKQLEHLTGAKYTDLVPNGHESVTRVSDKCSKAASASSVSTASIGKKTAHAKDNRKKAKKRMHAERSSTRIKSHGHTRKDIQEITNSLANASIRRTTVEQPCQRTNTNPVTQTKVVKSSENKDLFKTRRRLTKKLRQIDALKARQQKGEELSEMQLIKLGLEASIRNQLADI